LQTTDVIAMAPYLERGGTERHVLTLAQTLPSRYRAQVLAPCGPAQQEFFAAGVPVRNFHSLSAAPLKGALECRRLLRHVLQSSVTAAQLVHVHGAVELLWLAHTVTDAPIVFTVHGYHGKGAGISYKLAAKGGNKYADAVIAVSRSEREILLAAGLHPSKLHLVYNGVVAPSVPKEYVEQDYSCEKLQASTDRPVLIGTAARLVPAKGLSYLIEAMHLLTKRLGPQAALLLIYGDGPDRDVLQQQAASLGLTDTVEFRGYDPQVMNLMSQWDIFVLPSVIEPFGLVCAEAMAAGIPVIATNTGGLPEVLGDAGILVPVQDAKALAEAMHHLVEDVVARRSLGVAGYKRYKELFTAEAMAQKTAAVYDAVL
jgi:glycosyltransferase involved in cell wall biosynthesis